MTIKSKIATLAAAGLFAAFGAASPSRAQDSQIGVTVNGSQISFPGAQPVEMHGSVLVPLRGVFQALGAHVDYDPSTSTITAYGQGRTIVLAIGASSATINGQDQPLSQPAQEINGTTLVPLRFVAEALGDYVEWNSQNQMVEIQRDQAPTVEASNRFFHERGDSISGMLRHVTVVDDTRTLDVVTPDGQHQSITVMQHARILRGPSRDQAESSAIEDLQRGDHVWIHLDPSGDADSITAVSLSNVG